MLSKGGKIEFFCPVCGSPDITRVTQGGRYNFEDEGVSMYVYLDTGDFFCRECNHSDRWRARGKHSLKSGPFNPAVYMEKLQAETTRRENGAKKQAMQNHNVSKATTPKEGRGLTRPVIYTDYHLGCGEVNKYGVIWSPKFKEDFSHWTHRPDDFGVWVAYNSWRFKDHYDVLMADGTIHYCCYPNANSFTRFGEGPGDGDIDERYVVAVRLCTHEGLSSSWMSGGEDEEESNAYRTQCNVRMFTTDEGQPERWGKDFITLKFNIDTMKLEDGELIKTEDEIYDES